jgi:uncharacterized protein
MTTEAVFNPVPFVSRDLQIAPRQVAAVALLLAEGNTIPFVARYRKEVHGNLDEVQIQDIQEKLSYYNTLEDRRRTVLKSIDEQGKLTDELKTKIEGCFSKTELEDLYLPYKPKRRTRAVIAREKGLEPLAQMILSQALDADPVAVVSAFLNEEKEVRTIEEALAGARDIVAEQIAENAEIRARIRDAYFKNGIIASKPANPDAAPETSKYKDYFDFSQPVSEIPSHRYLAIRRGETEGELRRMLIVDAEPQLDHMRGLSGLRPDSPFAGELEKAIQDAYKRLLTTSVEMDVSVEMKMKADRTAVEIFAKNLRSLLLAAPFGENNVIGIDPGLRTGCKCVAVDATGKYLDTVTIFPGQSAAQTQRAQIDLGSFIQKYDPQAIAIGNGTAGRETETFVKALLAMMKRPGIRVIAVSEAGASVYSASPIAREEFPDLDLTVRGAISIARRLQDPLAELVKTDPKSIGVGQYQHDVYQELLKDKLDDVVVSCVNHVGVELNTASAPLLSRVAGVGETLARKIVAYRNENGAFRSRQDLLKVPGLGPRTFEQAAGFLRIRGGRHPLDASAVHPERYRLVETMAADLGQPLEKLVGNVEIITRISIKKYIADDVGEPTLNDIVSELKKPGRDPREQFEDAGFRDDVNTMADLVAGMELKGIVTNVTAFGAFVDIGVHQDGLVHVSQLCDRYISDPSEVVQAGDRISVRVLDVDLARKRISLTARKNTAAAGAGSSGAPPREQRPEARPPAGRRPSVAPQPRAFTSNPFANL